LVLGEDIPLCQPLDLAFAEHMYGFILLDRLLRRQKCPKSQPRIHTAFEKAMILPHRIIQIFALPQLDFCPFESLPRLGGLGNRIFCGEMVANLPGR
jgi:hypothetical protein